MDSEQSEANLRQGSGDFILSRLALSCKEQEDRSMKRGARFRGRLSKPARFSGLLLALLWSLEVIIPFRATADPPPKPDLKARALIPQPVYPLSFETGLSRLSFQAPKPKAVPSFWAIGSQAWPTGLIPVYQVLDRRSGKYQLVRKPSHGKENVTDPLFFALPLSSETDTSSINGRWELEATHRDGALDVLCMDWATFQGKLFGRMDPDTDYRFAWINGGTFDRRHVGLEVQYIDVNYLLKGNFEEGKLRGTWMRTDDADGGVWKASPIRTIVENLSGWEMLCLVSQPIATDGVFWSLHPQEEASENALGWVWRPSLQAETDGPRNLDP